MAKFRTKPFEIEAEQFKDESSYWLIQDFVGDRIVDGHVINNFQWANTYHDWSDEDPAIIAEVYDHLHSTWVGVKAGQWIIKGSKNEFYPCDPEIFESKYERVVESDVQAIYVDEQEDPIKIIEIKGWERMAVDE